MSKALEALFKPRSVAVIGASRYPGKIGHEILRNIILGGFEGRVFPVNPQAEKILGLKCYSSVEAVPEDVDLAVVAVPAQVVPSVVESAGRKGVKVCAVISSGFREVGRVELEEEVVKIAREHGVRVLGPNIFGIVYTPSKLNASFGPGHVLPGRIAFITQSGALGIALMGWAAMEGIGLSAVVSIGNRADIDEADLIEFFDSDPNTDVVLMYSEGVKRGREFVEAARKAAVNKPVIVIKAGKTEEGARAAASHTGALAGSDAIYDAAFRQSGVLRAATVEEAFDWARAFECNPLPDGAVPVVVTNGGGAAVLATDELSERGVKLPEAPLEVKEALLAIVPPFGSLRNPIDLTGMVDNEGYAAAVEACVAVPGVAVMAIYCQTAVTDPRTIASSLAEIRKRHEDRVLVVCLIGGEEAASAMAKLRGAKVAAYPTPERAASAFAALYAYSRVRAKLRRRAVKAA